MSIKLIDRLLGSRFWALVVKEISQILRNKQLLFLLLFPPTIQLLLYGLTLNPDVRHLQLGIVDYANTPVSRELVAALTENHLFVANHYSTSEKELGQQVEKGQVTAGLVIPPRFSRDVSDNRTAEVQVLIDGVDANTAGIAGGYIRQIVNHFNRQLDATQAPRLIEPKAVFLYNPGLISSWFFVPGMIGVVLTLIGTLVSSATVVREKDSGTLEQLLMTPAETWEILLAKVVPLFVLLMGDVLLALSFGRVVFGIPFRGNLLLFLALSSLYVLVGIGFGIMLATLAKSQQQVFLMSFFINLPLIQLSGAIAPIETMPVVLQSVSLLNPLRHYVAIVRGMLLKGVGLQVLWPHAIALFLFAIILLSISINRFRNQLS